jgi:arsenite methyltransferase
VRDLKGSTMTVHEDQEIRDAVREHYAAAAASVTEAGDVAASCCGPTLISIDPFGQSQYGPEQRDVLPQEALVASLGCGNPTALAELKPGETVLDLGSGGGIDVLLSARRVAPGGKAYGLDMTPQMHELAEANRAKAGVDNAEFLLGSIEHVPLPDASVDVIISNCVVNLSTDKEQVFREAFRVLTPGGRLAISDMVLSRELPAELAGLMALWTGCIAGALTEEQVVEGLVAAGFEEVSIEPTTIFGRADLEALVAGMDPAAIPADLDREAAIAETDGVIRSAFIRARKPA